MPEMNIKLQEEQVRVVVEAAILKLFTEEQRDTLIKDALKFLMEPDKERPYYGSNISPLQRCFREAVESATRKWFHEQLTGEADTVEKLALRDALSTVVMKVLTGDHKSALIDTMTDGVVEAFQKMKVRDY